MPRGNHVDTINNIEVWARDDRDLIELHSDHYGATFTFSGSNLAALVNLLGELSEKPSAIVVASFPKGYRPKTTRRQEAAGANLDMLDSGTYLWADADTEVADDIAGSWSTKTYEPGDERYHELVY